MKILFIYPNAQGYQRVPLGASILITILKNNGHEVELFDTTFMRSSNIDNVLRQEAGLVKPTEEIKANYLTDEQIEFALLYRLAKFKPDIVCATIVEDNYRYCNSLLKKIKEADLDIPIVVGGSTPTVAPEVLIKNPNIDHVIVGEGEESILDLIEEFSEKRNYWKVYFQHYTDLDTLPIQDLSLWDERHFRKAYDGKIYKAGFIEASRGCINNCSYCINNAWKKLYKVKKSKHFRRKSIDKVIEEAKYLKEKHDFNMFFFTDDDFLFMGKKRIREFAQKWYKEVDLPYWINTRTEVITELKLDQLQANCIGIGFGVESGSGWLRRNILNRKGHTNEQIVEIFDMIRAWGGIRTTANFMIGFPAERENDIYKTINLARKINADSVDMTFVSPYYGTEIHRVCQRLGYIEVDDEPGFEGMAKKVSMRAEPTINLPQIRKERLIEVYNNFQAYLEHHSFYHVDKYTETQKVMRALHEIRKAY